MKFEDISVGDSAKLVHKLTKDDIDKFVELTGDDNKIHTSTEYASKTSFKKPVAHGMLGASFISTIIGTKLPGDGALWFSQSLEFLMPVRIGDTLTVSATVISKDERTNVVELKTDINNQNHQIVTQGVAKVKVIEQEEKNYEPLDNKAINKVAIVIGGSGGIGAAVCELLAVKGFDVAIHYFKNKNAANKVLENIETVNDQINSTVCSCDIISEISVREMVETVSRKLGTISVLVNCASENITAIKYSNLTWNNFESHINNQIKGTFNLVNAISPGMEKQGYGKIINIDTQYVDAPESNLIPYITAKGALRGFSKSLAFDLASKGIRVNLVSPGMTDTDQLADIPERYRMITAAKTPLRKLATPKDVANVVVFLASNESDFICGETIRVNGGQVMI